MANIYTLEDPNTGEIRYVGQTKFSLSARLICHVSCAKTKKSNGEVQKWINSLKERPVIKLIEIVDANEADYYETFYIHLFKSFGFNLTNFLKSNKKKPLDIKEKIRIARTNNPRVQAINKGRIMSDQTKDKIRLKMNGRPSPNKGNPSGWKNPFKGGKNGFKHTPETLAKQAATRLKNKLSK